MTVAYGLLISLAAGLLTEALWLNFALLFVSMMMMVELNNSNALIRILFANGVLLVPRHDYHVIISFQDN